MSVDKKEYDVFKGLLSGSQVHTLDKELSIGCVQERSFEQLGDCSEVYVLHDPCDIRKPDSGQMEHIGKVLSLDKKVINGYKTFNSVALNPKEQTVHLLFHTTYSTEMPNYVKQETLENISQAPKAVQELVKRGEHINTKLLYRDALVQSSELLKSSQSERSVCHISDREFDDEALFDFIDDQGDTFVTRLKLSRLSNERKILYTPTGKVSKRVVYKKLIDTKFEHQGQYLIPILVIKGKTYKNVKATIEWDTLTLENKQYNVVRITLTQGRKKLFEHPMLLITNREIGCADDAKNVYHAYLLRFKIEVVFRFLKQNLGWEDFQVRDFNSIANLLALAVFLVGYFKELEDKLKKHPLVRFICLLAQSKGKITIFYILKGIEKLIHFREVSVWMKENNITYEQVDEMVEYLTINQT